MSVSREEITKLKANLKKGMGVEKELLTRLIYSYEDLSKKYHIFFEEFEEMYTAYSIKSNIIKEVLKGDNADYQVTIKKINKVKLDSVINSYLDNGKKETIIRNNNKKRKNVKK